MNILILSAGTRNKIIEYFKLNVDGKVIATDMQVTAPAVYVADMFYHVPKITDDRYLDIILDICKLEQVNAILSLIDPELSILAKNEKKFTQLGIKVIGSPYELCEMALDKMQMYQFCVEKGFLCALSYISLEDFYADQKKGLLDFPVFVKPIRGSASIAISKVEDQTTLELLFNKTEGLMIQEFLQGQEIGADVYIDLISGEVVSIFTKKKLLMRAGETDKSVSFKDERLFQFIENFAKSAGFRGQIDIDLFEINGNYYISEVNPRFGGGFPHAYECGCNHMQMIVNNVAGIPNQRKIGCYRDDVYMMKYNEVMVKEGLEL